MLNREIKLREILSRFPGVTSHAQRTRIITAIQELGSVTTFEANRILDCVDPRARKAELKHKFAYPIKTHFRHVATESGELHRTGVYYLESKGNESC